MKTAIQNTLPTWLRLLWLQPIHLHDRNMCYFKNTLYAPAKPTTIFSGKEKQLELHFWGDQPDSLEDVDTRKLLQKSRQSRKNAFNLNSGLFAKKKIDKKISPKIFWGSSKTGSSRNFFCAINLPPPATAGTKFNRREIQMWMLSAWQKLPSSFAFKLL